MVRRKLALFLATTLAISSTVVVGELALLMLVRPPVQDIAGAWPQAAGRVAHRAAGLAARQTSPLPLPSRVGPEEMGGSESQDAAPLAVATKSSLCHAVSPAQPFRPGEYAYRTDPADASPIRTGAPAVSLGKAPTLLLGALMMFAAAIVTKRRSQVPAEGPAPAQPPRRGTRGCIQPAAERVKPPRRRPSPRVPVMRDQTAEWERVRLVPT